MGRKTEISNRRLLGIAGLGWMFDAMDVGILSFIIAALKTDWNLTTEQMAWIGSVNENDQFPEKSSVLYFQVADIKQSFEELIEKGVSFIDEPHLIAKIGDTETWMAFFNDTEGNIHALMSEVQV